MDSRKEAILKMVMLRNMTGEYLPERDEYLFRIKALTRKIVEENKIAGVEEIGGIYYTRNAAATMKELVKYRPFVYDFNKYDEMYPVPEQYFQLLKLSKPVNIYTYYVEFRHSKVLEENTHDAEGTVYGKDFLLEKNGEKWRVVLRKYAERPPWRGLAWRVRDIEGKYPAIDVLYLSTGIYLKSKEIFPKVSLERGVRKIKDIRVRFYRFINKNPVLEIDRDGHFVVFEKGGKEIGKEFVNERDLERVVESVKKRLSGAEAEVEKENNIGGVDVE